MKVATWNVNSIRARRQHVLDWLDAAQPDVLCLQELKVAEGDFPYADIQDCGYEAAVFGQKTYNGVAILSRRPMSSVVEDLGDAEDDPQARLISAEVSGLTILSAYFPNGGEVGSDKFEYKLRWIRRLREALSRRFDPRADQVALCGDFNVAPFDDDIGRPSEWRSSVLACDAVRDALTELASFGLEDVFRPFHPSGGVFSWWDYRGRGFERGNGLRIDHVYCTPKLAQRTIGAIVDREERARSSPSDHAPVLVEFA
ncbi:MAG: exodeoxyribonuclease III [Deltaproteobacteria bacterium]|nr:exodeoxyribonuclease III [Deltaproteobacteria bacterium]NND27467.1 exodeoxyribonuclease III [Myxococcales bacterium]MBT8465453.1 exodeoxyribonuclease III [Deltaproteobacteria bacterium]MBT8482032.1 exodeoxyribonuclease III [Deltaproteobacteria bacterium]NNK07555.1 exodeoxyribonuclease III [Myxococcales bacterium]